MNTISWVLLFAGVSVALGYELAFTQATLRIGRSMSSDQSGRGFQDAITPPWSTRLGWLTYLLCLATIATVWWRFGWLVGLGSLVALPMTARLAMVVLPKPQGSHFRKLIELSLMNRYVDYERDGDTLRAEAAAFMLQRLGVLVPSTRPDDASPNPNEGP